MSIQTINGTATEVRDTLTFEGTQNVFKIENKGTEDIHFQVDGFTNIVIH